jgi:hypothetical protein
MVGDWTDDDRVEIAGGYLETAPALHEEDLDLCRLHVAVQRLGWSVGWQPPREHAHRWLEEAQGLSDRLGLV